MKRIPYPIWMFALVALVIAIAAFALAQLKPGAGVAFVAVATTLWTALVASTARKAARP